MALHRFSGKVPFAGAALVLAALAGVVSAQVNDRSTDGVWTKLSNEDLLRFRGSNREWIQPKKAQGVELNAEALEAILKNAPHERELPMWRSSQTVLTLPKPDGSFERFAIAYSPVYEEGLREAMAASGYDMRTYAGVSLDDPTNSLRLDFGGPQGFHGSVRGPGGVYFIDPYWHDDTTLYSSYYKHENDPANPDWKCEMAGDYETPEHLEEMNWKEYLSGEEMGRGGVWNLRTLRIAISATGEYTTWHGGVANAQAAITTTVNRMNQVYERDVSLRFLLIAGNINVVFPTAASDPYTSGNQTLMNQCRDTLITNFTNAGFDIGHLVSQGGSGGIAGNIGNACVNTVDANHKGRGFTSRSAPVGDPWDIDYVAHELGHQMGAEHTWNSCGGGSGHGLAVEPGSGITIMGYAGLCGANDDLAPNSIDNFHGRSILQIDAYLNGGLATCEGLVATTNNNGPTVDAGPNYTIPANTPFELTALNGTDLDGDAITYCWEQNDGTLSGQVTAVSSPSSTTNANFRPRTPTTNPTRVFPHLPNLLVGGTMPLGERLSTVTRTMTFRAFMRDNNPQGSRWSWDSMTLNIQNTGTAFAVTSPNGGGTLSGPITVTWTVAGTTAAPINTANVDIFLSEDGGNTYPHTLATGVPNSGTANVVLPNITTATARVKVKGSGNVFFDISNANFSVVPGVPTPVFALAPPATFSDAAANNNGVLETGEANVTITVPIQNNGNADATAVTGVLTSLTPTVSIVTGNANYPNINQTATQSNATPFVITVSGSHVCGAPVNLQLAVNSAQGGAVNIPVSFNTGTLGAPVNVMTENFDASLTMPTGWTFAGTGGTNRWAPRTGAASVAAENTAPNLVSFEPGNGVTTDRRLITPALANPTELRFFHTYRTEQQSATVAYDACTLEVSTSPTGPWTLLNSEITSGGYTRTSATSTPLPSGTPCWGGTTIAANSAPTEVVVNLSAWSAQTVYIAFRYTEDVNTTTSNQHWAIDNVRVSAQSYTCDPPTPPTTTLTAFAVSALDAHADANGCTGDTLVNVTPTYTGATPVSLQVSTDNTFSSGVTTHNAPASGTPYSFTLPAGDGNKTVHARLDLGGSNYSSVLSDTILLDQTPPTSSATTADDTVVGTNIDLNFTAGDGAGSGVRDTALWVIVPGQSLYANSGLAQTGASGMFPYAPALGGRYYFHSIARDHAGNIEAAPAIEDQLVYYNPTANAPLTLPMGGTLLTGKFPMEGNLDVTVTFAPGAAAGTLTVDRTTGYTGAPDGLAPNRVVDEFLSIDGSSMGAFSTASIAWQFDAAASNPGNAVTINHAFRYSGLPLAQKIAVTPIGNTATINGVTAFSDWYLGDDTGMIPAAVADWTVSD